MDAFIKRNNISREYLSTNRKSVTRALLVGLFWAFVPMPFQMVAVIACTPFIKFNVPLAIATVWISNPVTMPFIYYIEYITGSFLLGLEPMSVKLSIQWFQKNFGRIFVPLYVGTAFYSVVISFSTYYIIDWLWIHSVRHEKRHQKRKDNRAKKKS